ncbi:MAG: hypothetical protein KDA84_08565 [Planctomycetaceae bacterium]|nr:hypothetical protein [Planctomycetaceae bacterium]
MGKKIVLGIGAVILGLSCIGVYNAINDFYETPVENKDLSATGIVTDVYADQLEHTMTGATISTHYKLEYSFVAEDGERYNNTKTIDEAEFNALRSGQEITILYHSNQPSLNGAKDYGTYISVDGMPNPTPQNRLYGCLGGCAFGAVFIFAAVFGKQSED